MIKAFDTALYASTAATLVSVGGKFGDAATAHAPIVLVGFLEGAVTDETYLALLCAKAGVLSSKGKANANALETNGYGAVKRVYTDIKRIVKHLDVPGVRGLVEAFAGYMPDWDVELADDADAKAKAAHTRQIQAAIKARYPERPASFAALVKGVTTCINKAAKAAAEADGTDATLTDEAPVSLDALLGLDAKQPVSVAQIAEYLAERIAAASAEELADADAALASLAALIGGEANADADMAQAA